MPAERQFDFPATAKLHCRREYQRVSEQGRKTHTPHFIVLVLEKTEGFPRLGITASRKVGGAVQRNRVKRLVREFFRIHRRHLSRPVDISVIAKRGAPKLSYGQVCEELKILVGESSDQKPPWPKKRSSV